MVDPATIMAIGKGAMAVAPVIARLFGGGRRRPSIGPSLRRFLSYKPSYQLSPDELAFGERERARTTEIIGQGVQQARAGIAHRFRARGLGGPAEEQSLADVEQSGALAKVQAGRNVADVLSGFQREGTNYDRQRSFAAFGAELGDISRGQQRYDTQQAAFWNSLSELFPQLLNIPGLRGGGGGGLTGSAAPGSTLGPPRPEAVP